MFCDCDGKLSFITLFTNNVWECCEVKNSEVLHFGSVQGKGTSETLLNLFSVECDFKHENNQAYFRWGRIGGGGGWFSSMSFSFSLSLLWAFKPQEKSSRGIYSCTNACTCHLLRQDEWIGEIPLNTINLPQPAALNISVCADVWGNNIKAHSKKDKVNESERWQSQYCWNNKVLVSRNFGFHIFGAQFQMRYIIRYS